MTNADVKKYYNVNNIVLPPEGPVIVPVELDFGTESDIDIDGYQVVASGKLSYIQGVYIDNLDNVNPLTIVAGLTKQRVTCPANYQGYFSIFLGVPPHCVASTVPAPDLKINIIFYNVPMTPYIW